VTEIRLTFIHFSDTHLPSDPNFTPDGKHYPHRRARAVIEQINALPFPVDFALHTGDVGHDPADESGYSSVRETLSTLRLPLKLIPGNHDNARWLYSAIAGRAGEANYYTFDVKGVRFACLNSVVPKAGYGTIGGEQLAWLDGQLTQAGEMPVIVVLHHHPFLTASAAMDAYVLHDGEAFHTALAKHRERVKAVLFGHIHETTTFIRDGITYASATAVGVQLRSWPGQTEITNDTLQIPGFNVVTVMDDGTVIIRAWRAPLEL
jgi:3',5'-cyclic AMP phosphodiesterase CpdA